jgi:hypothetical protein
VAGFEDRVHLPVFLGNVLAYELSHALQGVVRHSSEGLMKAVWRAREYVKIVRGPLAFAVVDLELLRARFKNEMTHQRLHASIGIMGRYPWTCRRRWKRAFSLFR